MLGPQTGVSFDRGRRCRSWLLNRRGVRHYDHVRPVSDGSPVRIFNCLIAAVLIGIPVTAGVGVDDCRERAVLIERCVEFDGHAGVCSGLEEHGGAKHRRVSSGVGGSVGNRNSPRAVLHVSIRISFRTPTGQTQGVSINCVPKSTINLEYA